MNNLTPITGEETVSQMIKENHIVDIRVYNMIMGGTILYGLVINIVMCLIFGNLMRSINPIAITLIYVVCCVIGKLVATDSDKPVISFVGYNLVVIPMGLVLTCIVESLYIDSIVIVQAIIITACIVIFMVGLAIIYSDFFGKLSGIFCASILGGVFIETTFLVGGFEQIEISWLVAGLLSIYIGYEFWNSQQREKTVDNAVDSAMYIYFAIINLVIRILMTMGNGKGKRKR